MTISVQPSKPVGDHAGTQLAAVVWLGWWCRVVHIFFGFGMVDTGVVACVDAAHHVVWLVSTPVET